LQALPALSSYGAAIGRRIKGGAKMQSGNKPRENPIELFADVLSDLTPSRFVRACVDEDERYMAAFDSRLVRPRLIPALGKFALAILDTVERLRAASRRSTRSTSSG
jgi:hypothetical protein